MATQSPGEWAISFTAIYHLGDPVLRLAGGHRDREFPLHAPPVVKDFDDIIANKIAMSDIIGKEARCR